MYHAAGNGGRGSSSYIDSVILRDRDANGGGGWTGAADGTLEERRYYVQNWRADVVAMAKSDGTPLEYVFYSAYGEATVHPIADVDMDGDVDSYDAAAWDNGENLGLAYNYVPANVDLNWDGTEDAADDALFDESYAANVGLSGKGRMSSVGVGNRKGYAGYEHDESIAMYHVRHRVYRADLGRWMTRDPLGYVDGMGLYEYVAGMAVAEVDPSGQTRACSGNGASDAQIVVPPNGIFFRHSEWMKLTHEEKVAFCTQKANQAAARHGVAADSPCHASYVAAFVTECVTGPMDLSGHIWWHPENKAVLAYWDCAGELPPWNIPPVRSFWDCFSQCVGKIMGATVLCPGSVGSLIPSLEISNCLTHRNPRRCFKRLYLRYLKLVPVKSNPAYWGICGSVFATSLISCSFKCNLERERPVR